MQVALLFIELVTLLLIVVGSIAVGRQINKLHMRADPMLAKVSNLEALSRIHRVLIKNLDERQTMQRHVIEQFLQVSMAQSADIQSILERLDANGIVIDSILNGGVFDTLPLGGCWSPDENNFDEYDDEREWQSYLAEHPDAIRCSDIADDNEPLFGDLTKL